MSLLLLRTCLLFIRTFKFCFTSNTFYRCTLFFVVRSCCTCLGRAVLHRFPHSSFCVRLVQNVLLKQLGLLSSSSTKRCVRCESFSVKTIPSPCPSLSVCSLFPVVHMLEGNTAVQGCQWPEVISPSLQPERQTFSIYSPDRPLQRENVEGIPSLWTHHAS